MEIFYSKTIDGNVVTLDEEESGHCVRVLRHRCGDTVFVSDGVIGILYRCVIVDDSPKGVRAQIFEETRDWGRMPYQLDLAVCPTKNMDRYEWFVEKACEIGADRIIPIIGDRSERRVLKTDRLKKIALSACKQSLKGRITSIGEPVSVRNFLQHFRAGEVNCPIKLIAYCFENEEFPRIPIRSALEWLGLGRNEPDIKRFENAFHGGNLQCPKIEWTWTTNGHILIMIGPEGDFSPEEARMAIERDFIPVSLGSSRLRTETAAVLAASAVYFHFM